MATAAETAVLIREAMENSPGVKRIDVDGIRIEVDLKQLDYWERRAAREASPRTRPISASIDMSGGME